MKGSRTKSTDRADALHGRIRTAVVEMRPLLRLELHELDLATFDEASGTATLRIDGDCPDCELSPERLQQGIEAHLRQRIPEIRIVRIVRQ